jgi:NAD(P)-dependent dehydrogenase (short-subunit alcohol dehydrogenase family)
MNNCQSSAGAKNTRVDDTMNTVRITGCSSGYGLETARHFHSQGWNVIATGEHRMQRFFPDQVDSAYCRRM